jgi:N-acetylmuramoyl-L-alanine amidase
VVGSIHGDETAGDAIIRQLRKALPTQGMELWLVDSVNPDGVARGTRQNARGVDLNRNFARRWRGGGRPFQTYFPGPRAFSEPETLAVRRLVRRLRPDVTVWYHQHLSLVNLSPGADRGLVRGYARRVGLTARTLPHYRGTATSWQNHTFPGTSAFVVELPAGRLDGAGARRHADAVLAAGAAAAKAAAARRPRIVSRPIPFGAVRRAQMRAYAFRHYGLDSELLEQPKVIVEHYTGTATFAPAFNTFASNARDPELHERPGTCAHFIVDRDGTIYQLVSLTLMCRHTVGLNQVAIGIEHVGVSDGEILGRRRQLDASLRLTRWLRERYGIARGDVIGHAESLSSPYHQERVARLRKQTHGDFAPATMRRYRRRL